MPCKDCYISGPWWRTMACAVFISGNIFILIKFSTHSPLLGLKSQTNPQSRLQRGATATDTRNVSQAFDPQKLCWNRRLEMIICVPVARDHFLERQTVRDTWGSYGMEKNSSLVLVFFLGQGTASEDPTVGKWLLKEYEEYGDLAVGDFVDTYQNLTLKSLFMLKWVTAHCSQSTLLLKADDDEYINIPLLMKALREYLQERKDPFVMGRALIKTEPKRDKENKWYTPFWQYREMFYPTYISGTSYAMTMKAAQVIYAVSETVPFFWLEDVYITGLCAAKAGVAILGDERVTSRMLEPSGTTYLTMIAGSKYSTAQIRHIHNELMSLTNMTAVPVP